MQCLPALVQKDEGKNELLGAAIPLFLQLLTEELYRHAKRHSRRLNAEDATTIFQKVLLGETARDKLQHFRSRIDIHYPEEDRDAVRRMLNHLSLCSDGVARVHLFRIFRQAEERRTAARSAGELESAFQRLLLYLQSDFYIEETTAGCYDFSSRLLKTWWKKYYGYEYDHA